MIPEDLKYTKDHEWLRVEGDTITIGITEHAQKALGDIVFVELPEVGDTIATTDSFAVIESVKAASDCYSPIDGEVLEVNSELESAPETVNSSPYGDGWIAKIRLSDASQLDNLIDAAAYEQSLE